MRLLYMKLMIRREICVGPMRNIETDNLCRHDDDRINVDKVELP